MQSKTVLKIRLLSVNFDKYTSINYMDGQITVEHLKCCDWAVHKFIEVNFSKLN